MPSALKSIRAARSAAQPETDQTEKREAIVHVETDVVFDVRPGEDPVEIARAFYDGKGDLPVCDYQNTNVTYDENFDRRLRPIAAKLATAIASDTFSITRIWEVSATLDRTLQLLQGLQALARDCDPQHCSFPEPDLEKASLTIANGLAISTPVVELAAEFMYQIYERAQEVGRS